MTFANPHALWLLLVFPPAMTVFFWWALRRRQELMTKFIQARLLPGLVSGLSPARQKIRLAGLVLAVICLIVALARPQWGFVWEEVKHRGLDIVVAIDTSKSMLAEDIAPNRLTRAKLAALDLMQQAKSDRLGLVAFAGSAFLECPLTIDDAAFRQSVEALDVNTISQGGTALAEAIEAAAGAFKEGENYKVLVLFTDGEDQDSGAVEAAKKAAQGGLRIFTIGIGTTEGAMVQVTDAQGHKDYIRDEQDNVHKSHLNEELLRQIAGATEGGFYLPLRAKTIDALYAQGLAPLPKSESQEKLVKRYREQYQWPLAFAILLLAAEMIFPERAPEHSRAPSASAPKVAGAQKRPSARPPPLPQSAGSGAVALLLLLAFPALLRASPSSALRDYQSGDYDQALKEYDQLIEKKNEDPRLRFNAGAAAYRARQLEEAAKHFDGALSSPDLKLQQEAYYNRGNTFYSLGEHNPDPSKKTEIWQKSLQDFESSLKLNPQDADAKFNYQYVKKKLEELKQQQQQQQKNQQNQSDKNQDQQQQQQQNQQNQDSKKDQDQNSQSQQNKSDQKQDSSQQQPQPQPSQQQKDEDKKQQQAAQQAQPKESPDQKESQQAKAAEDQQKDKDQETEAAASAAGQMTPQQARQLLDAQKNDEMMLPAKPPQKPLDRSKPLRDW
jgi:Ca-activated chloride channel family protein